MSSIEEDLIDSVRLLNRSGLPMDEIAYRLDMSRASLYRRLHQPGQFTIAEYQEINYMVLLQKSGEPIDTARL